MNKNAGPNSAQNDGRPLGSHVSKVVARKFIPSQNTFNDFHSRDGAPDDEPFYTLADHAARILAKEQTLEELAGEVEGDAPEAPHDNDEGNTANGNTNVAEEATAADERAKNCTDGDADTAACAACEANDATPSPVHVVQQHLLIT